DGSSGLRWGLRFGQGADYQGGGGAAVRLNRGWWGNGEMPGAMGSMPGTEGKRFRTEVFLQAPNLLNHVNLIGFTGVQTSPLFGQATAALPGRRIETGMRFSF